MDTPNKTTRRASKNADAVAVDRTERIIFTVVLTVIAVVPALTFLFSFGNVGDLGVSLNVDRRIAYLTGPAIDLSVVGLIVAGSYLSHRGRSERELWPIHLMSVVCGLTMIALNCGQAVYQTKWRLAAFDAVGPLLLIGWGFVGPWLLRQLFAARSPAAAATARKVPTAAVQVPTERRQDEAPTKTPTADRVPSAPTTVPTAPPTMVPIPVPTATANGTPRSADRTADVIDMSSAGAAVRRPLAEWVTLALPHYRQYIKDMGDAPTAPQLADCLADAGCGTLKPSRARDVRKATAELAAELGDKPEVEPDRELIGAAR